MGNAESQNVEHEFYGEKHASLGRKHTSRSLRLSHKARRTRHASSGKVIHRNSEVSTRSSSTPSIPQSLAENGLEPFSQEGALEDFGSPIWVDRVDMGLRPVSYTDSSVTPSVDSSIVLTAASVQSMPDSEESRLYGDDATYLAEGGRRQHPCTSNGPTFMETASFKKKRSKSADIWREDSLEFSLSDLSQEHLTSNEEILGSAEEKDCEEARGMETRASPRRLSTCQRANSLSDLYAQKPSAVMANGGPRGKFAGYCRNLVSDIPNLANHKMPPAAAEEALPYSNYNTLPCRKSHCLSEGATNPQISHSNSMQGRRAKTTQDVNAGEGSEFADSGIEGTTTDTDLLSRRSNATNSSYSPPTGRAFVGSDSGSSSTGDAARQGVYENFRRELEMSTTNSESLEEAGSAHSDEQSSGTLSSPGQSDILLTAAQGTVRKAGALAVKNFLVHKKNKKVESATRRKWKHYWVSLKGCTLFFYESDGRSGIDHNSIPKHAVWVENSIVQAVPEHPKKDFVFCLSNSLGDAFLFQTTSQTELENWITAIHSACAAAVARHHHKEDTLRLLKSEIKKLEQKIDMDEKMKKMGEMQLSSVTDSKKKKTILDQIFVWEQNLEQFQMDLFRYRCYLASLQGGELPNPKRLLAFASRPTKVAMGRLGIFSVSSFHALVAARTGETGVRRLAIKTMNKVASHINEMQKIHEEFGAVFDQLIAEQTGEKKEVADLSMGDLLLHTTVIWPNPPASLGKWKKEPELAAFVFKTAVVLVYKDGSKQKKKLVGSHRLSIYEEWDPFRFRHMIPTEALQVRALASADAEANTVCEIVHVKSESEGRPERVFHLCCSSPENRKDLLKAVHSILRDKHRRQLLKTESLPSSQQYVPFGGKRLCALKGARPAMSRAVSAPSKSLGRRRRRLARNRFTIDSDAISASSPEKESQQPPGGGDTDRWVEEQFDLAQYEEQDDIKETDILSDDDEFCESVKGADVDRELQERLQAASLGQRERGRKPRDSHASRMTQLKKQAALSGIGGGLASASEEVIWVRREDFASSRKLNTEI
uniref:TIAM Rac1 associated GEF 1 n=1 Tax=Rousettus aegyptiacus TaxID=9407 RepID=A0A7J8HVX9_ROUAE|nr:TIAM Rac1 associated GEF 1 [Rousettus aegyptiacus]